MPFDIEIFVGETSTSGVSATPTILRQSVGGDLPHAVFASVSAWTGFAAPAPTGGDIYDARLHDIYYVWDWYYGGTDNSYVFDKPVNIYDGNARHTNGHRNSRYSYGFQSSHVYRTAGTYTPRLTAYELSTGYVSHETFTVVVGASQVSGADVIFVSPSGDFTDAPSGATEYTGASVASAISTHVTGQDTTPKRVLLNRGESYTMTGASLGQLGAATPSVYIDAGGGAGALPEIALTGSMHWNDKETSETTPTKDFIVSNVNFTGTFDSTVDTDPTNDAGLFTFSDYPPNVFLLDNVSVNDVQFIAAPSVPTPSAGIFFNDCSFVGFSYAFISGGGQGYFSSTGCLVTTKPGALVDATDQQGWGYRVGDETTNIHSCDMSIFTDWFGPSPRNGQAAIRLAADTTEGTRFNVQASFLEGGFHVGNSQHSDSPAAGRAVNSTWEKSYITAISSTVALINITTGGMTIRNNILNVPATTGTRLQTNGAFISLDSTDNQALNTSQPIRFYSNTLVNTEGGSAMAEYTNAGNEFTAVTAENNVIHQPNLSTPSIPDAPLKDDANTYFVSRAEGYRDSTQDLTATTNTLKTAGLYDLYIPETGSAAIQDATTGLVAYDDFTGAVRGATPSRGALEPA